MRRNSASEVWTSSVTRISCSSGIWSRACSVVNATRVPAVAPGRTRLAPAANMPATRAAPSRVYAARQLFAVAEAYPDLKANQNFLQLQSELSDIENKIAASRRFFNNSVQEYNSSIQQFPAVLLAGMFGFTQRGFFELDEAEKAAVNTAPSVKF